MLTVFIVISLVFIVATALLAAIVIMDRRREKQRKKRALYTITLNGREFDMRLDIVEAESISNLICTYVYMYGQADIKMTQNF